MHSVLELAESDSTLRGSKIPEHLHRYSAPAEVLSTKPRSLTQDEELGTSRGARHKCSTQMEDLSTIRGARHKYSVQAEELSTSARHKPKYSAQAEDLVLLGNRANSLNIHVPECQNPQPHSAYMLSLYTLGRFEFAFGNTKCLGDADFVYKCQV